MNLEFVKSKLKEGDIFKNRKALCEQLEVPYTNQTNPKNSQDKKWRQYFDFEKVKGTQKLRITKVFEYEKVDFSTKGSPMPEYLDPAVSLYLMDKYMASEDKSYVTISDVAEAVGICSQYVTKFYSSDAIYNELRRKYSSSSNNKDNESKMFKIMAGYVNKARSSYKGMIGGSLDRIEKLGLIKAKEVTLIKSEKLNYKICRLIEHEKYEDIKKLVIPSIYAKIQENIISKDEKDEPYFKEAELCRIGIKDDELREASLEEKQFIETVNNDVAKKYGCTTMQEFLNENARNPGITKKFFNECNKRCAEFNVEYFKAYRLDWCNCKIASRVERKLDDLMMLVNRKFIEHFSTSAMTKSEDNINKKHMEKLLHHNEHGIGRIRDERVDKMQGIEKNLATFINDFLLI